MSLHEAALRDYAGGDRDAAIVLRSDLGEHDELPVRVFFREPADFFPFERGALELCRGRVLDVGAGTGLHALVLQERGYEVCALELLPGVAAIARDRGVREVRREDVFAYEPERPFDTVLMLMNGVGIVGSLDGLARFLRHAHRLVAPEGQILVDSADLRSPGEIREGVTPEREDGRYVGEAQIQLEYRGVRGEPFQELYVDPDTLTRVAAGEGWSVEMAHRSEDGEGYLARLTRGAEEAGEPAGGGR